MTRREFQQRYATAVEKAALGVAIISDAGSQFGFSPELIETNREQLIRMLADGVGLSFESVASDVYGVERRFPSWLLKSREMRGVIGRLVGELRVGGFLSAPA